MSRTSFKIKNTFINLFVEHWIIGMHNKVFHHKNNNKGQLALKSEYETQRELIIKGSVSLKMIQQDIYIITAEENSQSSNTIFGSKQILFRKPCVNHIFESFKSFPRKRTNAINGII